MKKLLFISASTLLVIVSSCNKEPGEGGTSTIEGKVWVVDKNNDGVVTGEYYAMDEDVFIAYGDDQTYSDNFNTSYDGSYRFDNLTIGMYTVFAYSDCDTCASGMSAIKETVEITENKQLITVPDLVIVR